MINSTLPPHGRELPGKNVHIRPGEYLVYHFTVKDVVRCAPNGDALNGFNEIGYAFEDLAAAQQYCQWKVNENPKLGCLVYDHCWKVVDQFTNAQYMAQIRRAKSPKRRLFRGIVFLVLGAVLIWLEDRHNWTLIIGFLVGARLAVGGVVHIALSLMNWRKDSVE
jgi:hypothetical protein